MYHFRCVEKPDPCNPSPCGPGTMCMANQFGNAICRCLEGLVPKPDTITGCQPECEVRIELAQFRHFGKKLKSVRLFWRVLKYLGKCCARFGFFCYFQILLFQMAIFCMGDQQGPVPRNLFVCKLRVRTN